jgi:hypothetical protein
MNKIKTTRSLLSAVIVAAALGLVACGGGGDSKDAASVLPAGKVGTVGDGVNASEYAAIQCGMNKDQVLAIIGDAPTNVFGNQLEFNQPGYNVSIGFKSEFLFYKLVNSSKANIETVRC